MMSFLVSDVPRVLTSLVFTHARPYIDKHLCVVRHPFLPLGLHFRFGISPLSRIGLLPLGYN